MSNRFKHRLIGTIVLVALVVILLPSLLDGNKKYYQEQFASIPLEPKVGDEVDDNDFVQLSDKPPAIAEHLQSGSTTSSTVTKEAQSPSESENVQAEKPETPTPPQGEAYVVQLGALRNAEKVHELIALLRLSNYRVYTLPPNPVQGEVTRLFVGPYPSREEMQGLLAELKQLTGLEGLVRLYTTVREHN